MEHKSFIDDMREEKYYNHIERDPREFMQADEKVDLKTLPQYKGLSTQKTMLPDKEVRVI